MKKTFKVAQKGNPWTRFKNQAKDVICNPFNLLTVIAFIVLIIFVVIPLLSIIKESFILDVTAARRAKAEEGSWGIYYWQYLLTGKMSKTMFWTPLGHSLIVAFFACLVAVPLGALLAWLMVRSDIPGKKVISFLIVMAYMMPSWCKAQAWLTIFRNMVGGMPGILYWMGWNVPDWVAYGPFAMVCVLALHYYAFTYIMLAGSLGTINSELEEMALIQGAKKKTIILKITMPLVMPAFLSATVMTFSKAIGGYSVASYLGTRVQYHTLSTRLHDQIATGMPGVGYAIAILMILLSAGLILANNLIIGNRRSYSTINGKGGRSVELQLGAFRYSCLSACSCWSRSCSRCSVCLSRVCRSRRCAVSSPRTSHCLTGSAKRRNPTRWSTMNRVSSATPSSCPVCGTPSSSAFSARSSRRSWA